MSCLDRTASTPRIKASEQVQGLRPAAAPNHHCDRQGRQGQGGRIGVYLGRALYRNAREWLVTSTKVKKEQELSQTGPPLASLAPNAGPAKQKPGGRCVVIEQAQPARRTEIMTPAWPHQAAGT